MVVVSAPENWIESLSEVRFPPKADRRLQELMDRNTEGQRNEQERAELETLVELSEVFSLIRTEAIQTLRSTADDARRRDC